MLTNLAMSLGSGNNHLIDQNNVRTNALKQIMSIVSKFKRQYGKDVVIALDNRQYWRKEYFPPYKAHRKSQRDSSGLDWTAIFKFLDMIKSELAENFPYKCIDVDQAEADDVIATLCFRAPEQPIIIVSGDKDFMQLHTKLIKQYDPIRNKFIKTDDVELYLYEHILSGDRGDGIPNILSPDNCFLTKTRQKKMTAKLKQQILQTHLSGPITPIIPKGFEANYNRNNKLINMRLIPTKIADAIWLAYNAYPATPRAKIKPYLMQHRIKELIATINDF